METTKEKIRQKITGGRVVNRYGFKQIEAEITAGESLEFCEFLKGICIEKGRTRGTRDNKALTVISDWFGFNNGDIEVQSIFGNRVGDKRKKHILVWTKTKDL